MLVPEITAAQLLGLLTLAVLAWLPLIWLAKKGWREEDNSWASIIALFAFILLAAYPAYVGISALDPTPSATTLTAFEVVALFFVELGLLMMAYFGITLLLPELENKRQKAMLWFGIAVLTVLPAYIGLSVFVPWLP